MNNHQTTCDPDRIEPFLQQELSDEEQAVFERHLDDCEECRLRLESTAAGDDIWSGVRESLNDATFLAESGERFSLDSAIGGVASFSHDTVLKLLAPTDHDRMIGRLGTYEVVGVIGSGGFGVVLKAFDAALNRYVAIKVLAPHLGDSGAARKRFSREAQAAAAVVHDNVIEIHGVADVGRLPYLVMSYVRGPSLQRRLDEEGPLALVEILRIGMQAATGLAAAHAQGLVHRDVKPANILLAEGIERVKLTDFGLARAADDASVTKTGVIAGTPQYMSPEQARGETVDQRSDLFSLGSVLYAMCTGRPPFRAETSYGMLRRITDDEPQPIREINPEIPEWLCRIIAKLMSKQPDDRFNSAHEVAELLEEYLAHVQQPTTVPLPENCYSLQEESSKKSVSLIRRSTSKVRRVLGVVVATAVLGLGLLGAFLWSADPPDISGKWTGDGWGRVTLEENAPGQYEGTYTDTFGEEGGALRLKWSRIERRFNGTWGEGEDRFGKISVRLVDGEVRGAWTTNKKSEINPGTPELADLLWVRGQDGKSRTRVTTNQLIGSWRMVLPKKDGTIKPSPEKVVFTFDSWKMAIEYKHEDDNENFLYKLRSGNVIQLLPIEATSDEEAIFARYKLIGRNNIWIAVPVKPRVKPPLRAEPTIREKDVNYVRLVRVETEQNGPNGRWSPTKSLKSTEQPSDSPQDQPRSVNGPDREETADIERIQGVWLLESEEQFGNMTAAADPKKAPLRLVVKDQTLHGCFDAPWIPIDWDVEFDSKTEPQAIYLTTNANSKVKKWSMRFRLSDDRLVLCFDRRNPGRLPVEFKTAAGSNSIIWNLRRDDAGKLVHEGPVLGNQELPKHLQNLLDALSWSIKLPSNASVKEFADRYEISASPWQKATMTVDADDQHEDPRDNAHKLESTQSEFTADEGILTIQKTDERTSTFELVGNARFEGEDDFRFSADRIVIRLRDPKRRMTLVGNARLADDEMDLAADRIKHRDGSTLLEGNATLRRESPTGKSGTIRANRLEINHVTGAIQAGNRVRRGNTGDRQPSATGPVSFLAFDCTLVDETSGDPVPGEDFAISVRFVIPRSEARPWQLVDELFLGPNHPATFMFTVPKKVLEHPDRDLIEVRWTIVHSSLDARDDYPRIRVNEILHDDPRTARETLRRIKLHPANIRKNQRPERFDEFNARVFVLQRWRALETGRSQLIAAYQQLLRRFPDHPDRAAAMYEIANAYQWSGSDYKPDDAKETEWLRKACAAAHAETPLWFEARFRLQSKLRRTSPDDAQQLLEEILANDPGALNEVKAWYGKQKLALDQNDDAEAERICRMLLDWMSRTDKQPTDKWELQHYYSHIRQSGRAMLNHWERQHSVPLTEREAKIDSLEKDYPILLMRGRETAPTRSLRRRRRPADREYTGTRLSDAVREFNRRQEQDVVGKHQPPLTDDEVIASIRWNADSQNFRRLSGERLKQLREIAEKRTLASGWKLEFVTEFDGVEQEQFQVWSVRLVFDRNDEEEFSHVVRNRLLWQLDADGQPEELPDADDSGDNADVKPLAAAIHGFNSAHRSLGGIDQPALTQEEVVAAIRWWKTRRNEVDVTNGEFAALQEIADKRRFPEGAELEVVSSFQPGDGFEYLIWSVRLNLPKTVNRVPFPRYGITVRQHYLRSRPIDGGKISWGPVAENGMQAGVRFEPHNEQYLTGQQVTPRFFYRYSGDQKFNVSFPRLMTRGYYDQLIAVDSAGKAIPVDQDKEPGGPVGWMSMPFGFGSRIEIRGLPIVLGDVERGSAESAIRAKPGESLRVRFTLPNYALRGNNKKDAKPLETGEIAFSMAKDKPNRKVARLVLVFFEDRSRRSLPAVLVDAGSETLVVTAAPATIVPDDTPPAVDRAFLDIPGRAPIKLRYQTSTNELNVYRAEGGLSDYRPTDQVEANVGDVLAAIVPGNSADFQPTPNAARIVALDGQADLDLSERGIQHHYDKLVEIDRRLPEGTPLFKDEQLVGLVLLGTRFLSDQVEKSYVVPVGRIAALCGEKRVGQSAPDAVD